MMRIASLAAIVVVLAACTPGLDQSLNPDPVHGGACHDGDQLGKVCASPYSDAGSWCCHGDDECGVAEGECYAQVEAPTHGPSPADGWARKKRPAPPDAGPAPPGPVSPGP